MNILLARPNFTIVTGCAEIHSGFEIDAFDLALNVDLLAKFKFVSMYAIDFKNGRCSKTDAINFFISYVSELSSDPKERYKIWRRNPKIQILIMDSEFLKECLQCLPQ